MALRYDATLKAMIQANPADWTRFLGLTADTHTVVDADVSAVTAACDKVIRLTNPDMILHLEFQAGKDASLPSRIDHYNKSLEIRHNLPIQSVLFLLTPKASLPSINGVYERFLPNAPTPYRQFEYQVLRIWEIPLETILQGGPSILPLTAICAGSSDNIPNVIIPILKKRWNSRKIGGVTKELWTAFDILLGLRFSKEQVQSLLQGVYNMKESSTYRAILEEGLEKGLEKGREEGKQKLIADTLVELAQDQFQIAPPARILKQLRKVTDQADYLKLLKKLRKAKSWEDWLS